MTDLQPPQPLQYFMASLAGIARALEDFGYEDEAGQLLRVKKVLETKSQSLAEQPTNGASR
ncbi:MAG: hypothetical protein V4559_09435 [Pseudomonadota bacterium]